MRQRQGYRRIRPRKIGPWPTRAPSPEEVAPRTTYVGSAEHKSYPSPAGHPKLRSGAYKCEYVDNFEGITDLLRKSIRERCTSTAFDGDFPRYVWGVWDGGVFEARHINGPEGTYKGYMLEPVEYPLDPAKLLNLP